MASKGTGNSGNGTETTGESELNFVELNRKLGLIPSETEALHQELNDKWARVWDLGVEMNVLRAELAGAREDLEKIKAQIQVRGESAPLLTTLGRRQRIYDETREAHNRVRDEMRELNQRIQELEEQGITL